MVDCINTEHKWEVFDVITDEIVVCECEVCGEKAQFFRDEHS